MTGLPVASIAGYLFACALIAWIGARLWRSLAIRRGWVDLPGARRSHAHPTPRGGGIGIAIVLGAALLLLPQGPLAVAGLLLAAGAGLLDDLRPLPALAKLGLQAAGAGLLALAMPLVPAELGATAGVLLAFALTLATINCWNFMDGSNGMAALQAIAASLGLALLLPVGHPALWVALALAAASLGFLPENFPRARIFLGDVGSHAVGYGVAALVLANGAQASDLALASLPLAVFAIDTGLTLLRRALHRENLLQPHREHLYQLALRAGHRHSSVALAYGLLTLVIAFSLPTLENTQASLQLPLVLMVWSVLAACWWIGVRHFRARLGPSDP